MSFRTALIAALGIAAALTLATTAPASAQVPEGGCVAGEIEVPGEIEGEIECEIEPGAGAGAAGAGAGAGADSGVPAGGVSTGFGGLADEGSTAPWLLGLGIAAVAGAGVFGISRMRSA
jgi:hypothetical protein